MLYAPWSLMLAGCSPRFLAPPFTWCQPSDLTLWLFYLPGGLLFAAMVLQTAITAKRLRQDRCYEAALARGTAMLAGRLLATVWAFATGIAMGCNQDQEDPAAMALGVGILVVFIAMGFRTAICVGMVSLHRQGRGFDDVGVAKALTLREYAVVLVVGACVFVLTAVLTRLVLGDSYTG